MIDHHIDPVFFANLFIYIFLSVNFLLNFLSFNCFLPFQISSFIMFISIILISRCFFSIVLVVINLLQSSNQSTSTWKLFHLDYIFSFNFNFHQKLNSIDSKWIESLKLFFSFFFLSNSFTSSSSSNILITNWQVNLEKTSES